MQGPKPAASTLQSRSLELDSSFLEERGKGVIDESEVLLRGEWKRPLEEEEEEEEEEKKEEKEETAHACAYCGKHNVR